MTTFFIFLGLILLIVTTIILVALLGSLGTNSHPLEFNFGSIIYNFVNGMGYIIITAIILACTCAFIGGLWKVATYLTPQNQVQSVEVETT